VTCTQLGMMLGGTFVMLASSVGYVLTAREVSAWGLIGLVVGGACGVGACAVALREYRRGWPK
jgi:hypothetical protein